MVMAECMARGENTKLLFSFFSAKCRYIDCANSAIVSVNCSAANAKKAGLWLYLQISVPPIFLTISFFAMLGRVVVVVVVVEEVVVVVVVAVAVVVVIVVVVMVVVVAG